MIRGVPVVQIPKSTLVFMFILLLLTVVLKISVFMNLPTPTDILVAKCSNDCYDKGYTQGDITVHTDFWGNLESETCTCRNRLSEVLWNSEQ